MTCTCILCKRKVKACNKPLQIHWTPRNAAENIQRQRHQLRRRRSQASRVEGCFRGPTNGSTEIRNGRRIHLRLYTTQGTALRRVMGGGSEVRQTPSRARNRQRAAHRRRTADAARRGRGRIQLTTPGTTESGRERWRGPNTSAPTSWVPPSSAVTSPSIDGPNALLRQMATCLLSQATVLATVVQDLPVGSSTEEQVIASEAQPRAERPRPGSGRQHTTAAMGARPRRRNRNRARRQGPPSRRGNQSGRN
ncbi:uncharacterized protein LOC128869526 [Anastrepha ludens]|uniref:uncharacterized protein LOC128869526 n=1 Tax=Anastrepha ludens TaxID=28586 RepID=UPI0023B082E4|nr:uncharacterized protein LOC128869526 [Anastrepha ludens]